MNCKYGNSDLKGEQMDETFVKVKKVLEEMTQSKFNSAVIVYYHNASARVGAHADKVANEDENQIVTLTIYPKAIIQEL